MSRIVCASSLASLLLGVSAAATEPVEPHDAWLMKNYRFTGPPPAGSIRPVDPVVAELRQIQSTLISIMHRAAFDWDYEAALAAAAQAASNAQAIGVILERLQSAAVAKSDPPEPGPVYAIALRDRSIEFATSYWYDGLMLHYMTRQGAHVQVRLNLVDRALTTRLNQASNVDFRLPE